MARGLGYTRVFAEEGGEDAGAAEQRGLVTRLGLHSTEETHFPEWQAQVDAATWYRASCFAYCVAGGLLLLRPEPLERHMPLFPWRVVGIMIFANGFLSYMADVQTWGRPSPWKTADRVLATINSLLQLAVVLLACMGQATFPPAPVAALGTGVATGLFCKQRASAAMDRRDCDAYLRWHSAWHYTLPTGAVVGQLLLHRPCDYAIGPSASCAAVDAWSRARAELDDENEDDELGAELGPAAAPTGATSSADAARKPKPARRRIKG
jgi:hypothetical protein